MADAAQLSSLADETPEGRSIVVLAKEKYGLRGRHIPEQEAKFIPFSAYTRMSGVDADGYQVRKGAGDAVLAWVREQGGDVPPDIDTTIQRVALEGGTPLEMLERFAVFPQIQVIDLDAAMGKGSNDALVELIASLNSGEPNAGGGPGRS